MLGGDTLRVNEEILNKLAERLPQTEISTSDQAYFTTDEVLFLATLRFKSQVLLRGEMVDNLDEDVLVLEILGRMRKDFEDQLLCWLGEIEQNRLRK